MQLNDLITSWIQIHEERMQVRAENLNDQQARIWSPNEVSRTSVHSYRLIRTAQNISPKYQPLSVRRTSPIFSIFLSFESLCEQVKSWASPGLSWVRKFMIPLTELNHSCDKIKNKSRDLKDNSWFNMVYWQCPISPFLYLFPVPVAYTMPTIQTISQTYSWPVSSKESLHQSKHGHER